MYVVPPPKGSSDTGSNGVGSGDLRVYQTWKGSNIFFLQGRFIFGPDVRSLALTIFLIVAPVALFCIFVARKLMDDFSDDWGISIMAVAVVFTIYDLVLLLLTSGRDPGIIPRNAHPPEPEGFDGSADVGSDHLAARIVQYAITVSKDLTITALGLGNALAWKIMGSENISTWKAMIKTPSSIVLIVYTFISMWFVGGLTAFHLYLISTNQTTYENFRYHYDRRANPFYKGLVENFKESFCSSIPPSKNNFRATVPREPALPNRTLGGGFMSPNMGKAVGDIEMGRKTVWGDMSAMADGEGQLANNDRLNIKDGELGELSPDIRTTVDEAGDRGGLHPRRSSWGRKSGSWEMSPEVLALAARVGESNRSGGGSSLTTENQQS
ncbi:hypothetical protein DKX38_025224 [Salix brachista]|uniref:protein S-acyltransferase n=1 Tax=Salix brachista TaxID=2182728 RepID=A0A5N5JUN6_9ROSI|nr:hypothetical protein DKX38_025224 [Salix brachista]